MLHIGLAFWKDRSFVHDRSANMMPQYDCAHYAHRCECQSQLVELETLKQLSK